MAAPTIRWRESDIREIQRIRKNYNAKITRLEKKGFTGDQMPERITQKQIMSEFVTRQDYRNFLKEAKDFTTKGAERLVEFKGHQMPEYEKKRIIRMQQSVQQQKTAKRSRLSAEAGNLTNASETEVRPINTQRKRTSKEWDKYVKALEAQFSAKERILSAEKYKEQYLKNVKNLLGKDGEKLYNFIEKQDALTIAGGYQHDAVLSIKFTSDPIKPREIADSAMDGWKKYISGLKKKSR